MHPLVRDLYKRALIVGKDYPHPEGLSYVRKVWKKALRDYKPPVSSSDDHHRRLCEKDLLKAVAKGRFMIREMIGVIQLKKYRQLKSRYDTNE